MSRIRLAVALAVLATALLSVAPAQATFPGKNGKIVFFRGDQQNYTVDPDGSNLTRLPSLGAEVDLSWSADGQRIAFSALPPTDIWNIYFENPDGTGKTQVTATPTSAGSVGSPTWSPDGERIAYSKRRSPCGPGVGCFTTLNVINADGTGDHTLCCDSSLVGSPSWSPDGTKIAFLRSAPDFGMPFSLWTMNADGSDPERICCDSLEPQSSPDWSPDGRTILFGHGGSLYRVNADGSGLTTLYSPAAGAPSRFFPSWSPDARQIVFSQRVIGSSELLKIYTSQTDGSNQRQVTNPQSVYGGDSTPRWQPIPGPKRADYKNSNQFCKAEEAFWGDQFASRYGGGAKAFGKCVSQSH